MARRVSACLAAAALALATATQTAAWSEESPAGRLAGLHDQTRSDHGLRTLGRAGDLAAYARRHAERMAASGDIYHSDELGRELPGYQTLGENVGVGPSVDDIFAMFMDSGGHRANILDRVWDSLGTGVVVTPEGDVYVAVVFGERTAGAARPARSVPRPRAAHRPRPAPAAVPTVAARPSPAPKPVPDTSPVEIPAPEATPPDPERAVDIVVALAAQSDGAADAPEQTALALGDVASGTARSRFASSDQDDDGSAAAARTLGASTACAWRRC